MKARRHGGVEIIRTRARAANRLLHQQLRLELEVTACQKTSNSQALRVLDFLYGDVIGERQNGVKTEEKASVSFIKRSIRPSFPGRPKDIDEVMKLTNLKLDRRHGHGFSGQRLGSAASP